jgi:hypothetical protein
MGKPSSVPAKPLIYMAMYGHPENYPPTLNAIACLAKNYQIEVLYRAHEPSAWSYPAGVALHPDGAVLSAREQEQLPIWAKIGLFWHFCRLLKGLIRRKQPQVVLCYDALGLLAYYLVSKLNFGSTPLLWYHNHDVYDLSLIRKYSLSWWAVQAEKWLFPQLTLFSLPAEDRQRFFPMQLLKGQFFFLPNYPAKSFYAQFYRAKVPQTELRILFQGQVGSGHGIEEILALLPSSIAGLPLKLVVKGVFRAGYDEWLQRQIQERNLATQVEIYGYTPYAEVPKVGAECHIGLAIFTKTDIMNQTLGTASNKIYEYAALGLPILYYDNAHFRAHLQQYPWTLATDLSRDSLVAALTQITTHYAELSAAAHQDYLQRLNFEHYFAAAETYLAAQLQLP